MTHRAELVGMLVGLAGAVASGCSSEGSDDARAGAGGDHAGSGTGGAGTAGDTGAGTGGDSSSGAAFGAGNQGGTAGEGDPGEAGAPNAAGSSSDQPYAHVTHVSVTGSSGSFEFSVSVESADLDCSQFANWWEVLGEDGTLLYRRILEHSHTDGNGTTDADAPGNTFTRSGGPVPVAADGVVIVRAHMSNVSGYNGHALRGSAAFGFSAAEDIGPDFAAEVEDDEPQPGGCAF
jgi:hypothetical protein